MRICVPNDTVAALVDSGLPLAISCARCQQACSLGDG